MATLGVDPGLAKCGFCLLSGDALLGAGVIRTKKSDGSEADRIRVITAHIRARIEDCREKVMLIAVETQHAQGGDPETQRARSAAAMSVAAVRGAVIEVADSLSIPVAEVSPQEAKRALTRSGKADKQQMVAMARARFNENLTQDAADACGLALAGQDLMAERQWTGREKLGRVTRSEALDGLPENVRRAAARGAKK